MYRVTKLLGVLLKQLAALFTIGIVVLLTGCTNETNHFGGSSNGVWSHSQSNQQSLNYSTASMHSIMQMLGLDRPLNLDLNKATIGVQDTFMLAPFSDVHTAHQYHSGLQEPLKPGTNEGRSAFVINGRPAIPYSTRHGTLVSSVAASRGKTGSASPGIAPGIIVYRMNIPTYLSSSNAENTGGSLHVSSLDQDKLVAGLQQFHQARPQQIPAFINISMVGNFPLVAAAKRMGIVIVAAAGNNPDINSLPPASYAGSFDQMTSRRPWIVAVAMANVLPDNHELPSYNYYKTKKFEGHFVKNNRRYHIINTGTSCNTMSFFCLSVPIHYLTEMQTVQVSYTIRKPIVYGNRGVEVVLKDGARYFAYGTSFAAPIVTGALGYLKAKWPSASNDLLMNRLLLTATLVGPGLRKNHPSLAEISQDKQSLAEADIITVEVLDPYLNQLVHIRYHKHFGRGVPNVARALQPICLNYQDNCELVDPATAAVLSSTIGLALKSVLDKNLQAMPMEDDLGSSFLVDLSSRITWNEPEPPHLGHILTLFTAELEQFKPNLNRELTGLKLSDNFYLVVNSGELIPQATTQLQQKLFATSLAALYPYQVMLNQGQALHLRYGSEQQRIFFGSGVTVADHLQDYAAYLTIALRSNYLGLAYSASYVKEEGKLLGSRLSGAFGSVGTSIHYYHNLELSLHIKKEFRLFISLGRAKIYPDFTRTSSLFSLAGDQTHRYFSLSFAKSRILSKYDSFSVSLASPLNVHYNHKQLLIRNMKDIPWRIDLTYRYKTPNHGLFSLFMNFRSGVNQPVHYSFGTALILLL